MQLLSARKSSCPWCALVFQKLTIFYLSIYFFNRFKLPFFLIFNNIFQKYLSAGKKWSYPASLLTTGRAPGTVRRFLHLLFHLFWTWVWLCWIAAHVRRSRCRSLLYGSLVPGNRIVEGNRPCPLHSSKRYRHPSDNRSSTTQTGSLWVLAF